MTLDNQRTNIAEELRRSDEALAAAEALLTAGFPTDSVSRAYYAAYHALRALLLSRSLEPRSHSGAIALFARELVRPGHMPSSYSRLLAGLQRSRELADYSAALSFSPDDARAQIEEARSFVAAARDYLRREGLTG